MTDLSDLTPRQLDVAALVAEGVRTKVIAARLRVGERWVRCVISSVAYLIGADATLDERVLVACWWRMECEAWGVSYADSDDRQRAEGRAS